MGEPPPSFTIAELGGEVDQLRKDAIEAQIEWEWVHYDDPEVKRTPGARQLWEDRVRPDVERMFADLPDLFSPYKEMPEESVFPDLAKSLYPALACLVAEGEHADFVEQESVPKHSAYNVVNSIDSWIPDWSGEAAAAFERNVAPAIPVVVWNEFNAVEGLRGPLFAAHDMWLEARKDVCRLVEAAQHAIDLQRADAGGSQVTASLTLISALISFAAAPITGGSSLAISVGVITGAIGIGTGAAKILDDRNTARLSGESPAEVINALRRELTALGDRIYDQEWRIAENLIDLTNTVRGAVQTRAPERPGQGPDDEHQTEYSPQKAAPFTMPRPALANTTEKNATDDQHVGSPGGS